MKTPTRFGSSFAALAATALTTLSLMATPAGAQSRTCIVDDSGRVICGRVASDDEVRRSGWGWNRDGRRDRDGRDRDGRDDRDLVRLYDQIDDLYQDILGRRVDRDGLRTYTDRIQRGWSLQDVRQDLAKGSEAEQALNQIYREVLGREIDRDGLKTYRRRLIENNWSLRDVRRDVSNSREARGRR